MNSSKVSSIELTTNNKDKITITNESFKNLFVGNIDEFGDKINSSIYSENFEIANCFFVKIINDNSYDSKMIIERLLTKKDIIGLNIQYINKKIKHFNLAKKRILENEKVENKYNTVYKDENDDLCILVTDKKIKFIEGLFI